MMKKFPWLSLTLLLVTYSTLGWMVSAIHASWFAWLVVGVAAVLLAGSLIFAGIEVQEVLEFVFKSDSRAFFVVVIAAFLSVVILFQFAFFAQVLVVLCTGSLARLDIVIAGFSRKQSFWLLSCISLVGLGLGGLIQTLASHWPLVTHHS